MKMLGVLVACIVMLGIISYQPMIFASPTDSLVKINPKITTLVDKIDKSNIKAIFNLISYPSESGVWIITNYNGIYDETKLDIDLYTFKLMLDGGGWKYYTLSMEKTNDTRVGLQFVRTKIYVEGSPVDVIQTHFTMDTSADTSKSFEVSMEIRFPFDILKPHLSSFILDRFPFLSKYLSWFLTVGDDSYFSLKSGFFSPGVSVGPEHIETRFFFGRNSIWDPSVFCFIVSTSSSMEEKYPLAYNASYMTFDSYGNEAFKRGFSITLDPAADVEITSIPGNGKIEYSFSRGNGRLTDVSFRAFGGRFQDIIHHFIINPLPSYMSFDLTLLGERFFIYESDETYDVTYVMDSIEEGRLVEVELTSLPRYIKGEWGLSLSDSIVDGLIDLDMSSDISKAALKFHGSNTSFLEVKNFPKRLRLEGYIDTFDLRGSIRGSKYSGKTMTLTIPLRYKNWLITGILRLNNGGGSAFFDLPSNGDSSFAMGIDTNGIPLFGFSLSVVDTDVDKEVLYIGVDAVATDDFSLSFDSYQGSIRNLRWYGFITKLMDLVVSIDFQGVSTEFNGSWTIGESGSLELKINKPVEINFGNITSDEFKFNGYISLNENSYLKLEWEWGESGYFMIYTNKPIGDSLYFEIGYGPQKDGVYEYGLKASATGFLDIKRTIMWDTEDGHIPRIWVLGDKPFPGSWDVWLLWKYNWYEVI